MDNYMNKVQTRNRLKNSDVTEKLVDIYKVSNKIFQFKEKYSHH